MRASILITLLLGVVLFSCGGEGQGEAEQASPTAEQPSPAALRSAYARHLSALGDTLPSSQIVEPGKLYPVDEALKDTLFFVFREELLDAVRARDILEVMKHVSEAIEGPEDEKGLEAFTRRWGLESESQIQGSELWQKLEQTLTEGGAFDASGSRFLAPFAFATFPRETYDTTLFGAVTGAGVRLRSAPTLNSTILTLVSNDIVPVLEIEPETQTIGDDTFPWARISSPGETEGFIWGKFLWHPGRYHAIFTRSGGQWALTRFAQSE